MPKRRDSVWLNFECIDKANNTGNWARCKICKKEMQGIPLRMKKHATTCFTEESSTIIETPSTSTQVNQEKISTVLPAKRSILNISKDTDIISTSTEYAQLIDKQIGKYFYSTNTAFLHADHAEFKEMCNLLRPGYKAPSAYQIGGQILEQVYEDVSKQCKEKIEGETVSMCLDGWSNIHNEPLVCCSIVTQTGFTILVHVEDTSGNSHTASYLKQIASKAIQKTEENYNVLVKSFVTDNAANVEKMRKELVTDVNIIHYGCSSHLLNLLAHDVEVPAITENILKVIKYFRNKHLPSALYKQAGGKKFVMPSEVRWNTMNEAVKSFLDNRGTLVQLCQDNKDDIDRDISRIVNDVNLVANAKDLMARLYPISVALDRTQRDATNISIAVEIWNKLEKDLREQPLNVKRLYYKRRDMALGAPHYLSNLLDHRFLGERLNNSQKELAYAFLNDVDPNFVPFVMSLTTKSDPFPKFLFGTHFRNTNPLIWWKSVTINESEWPNKSTFIKLCEQLHTAIAATAGLERYFSTFGIVQSQLRNRLGNDKASKLVFMFKYFNQNETKKKNDLDWIWQSTVLEQASLGSSSEDDDLPVSRM